MSDIMTKSMARNVFYGGSIFFFAIFVGLTAHSHWYMRTKSTDESTLSPAVARGKHVWERNSCINCHTLLGEGAYFAPELGNVYKRRGGDFIKGWMQAMPTGAPGRRQMPNFNLTDEELDQLVAFLKYTSEINTANGPPNIEG